MKMLKVIHLTIIKINFHKKEWKEKNMKKSLIATGAASIALAAMPMAATFAGTSTVTDTLNVNIPASCTLRNSLTVGEATSTENVYNVTMKNGQFRNDIGQSDADGGSHDSTIVVNCNVQSGSSAEWSLAAAGKAGATTLSGSAGSISTAVHGDSDTNSSWAFKTAANGVDYAQGYASDTFAPVPASATIATGTGNATFTMTYQVYISTTQPTGTYSGGVVYTLTNPRS